jgi:hypothetical protein
VYFEHSKQLSGRRCKLPLVSTAWISSHLLHTPPDGMSPRLRPSQVMSSELEAAYRSVSVGQVGVIYGVTSPSQKGAHSCCTVYGS